MLVPLKMKVKLGIQKLMCKTENKFTRKEL